MAVDVALEPFDLRDVQLAEGPCLVAQEANRAYLNGFELDRLLWAFRENAGLPTPGEPLGGWEAPEVEVRGHFPGHYLSAAALMYRATGDEELKAKADAFVDELAAIQERLGGGYLAAFPEEYMDRLEQRDRVTWAPLYVIHKIMAGLHDMHTLAGNEQAKDVLVKMADYYADRAEKLNDYQFEQMLQTEFGGMSEVLHNVYGLTGDPRHLAVANRYDQAAFLGPLALKVDNLSYIHGNTQIPKICGAARRYELTGEETYRDLSDFFWRRVTETRMYATGGTTSGEHWPEPNQLAGTLSTTNQECCKTHNMLKVTRYLQRWTGGPEYVDYYRRAFWNGIMGTQHPETGMLLYYVPLATGHTKKWGTPYDSFWCCYGTGVETFSKVGDSIYFHDEDGIYVHLFVPSSVEWKAKGVRLEQVTNFPEQEGTSFIVNAEKPTQFALNVHVPYWAKQGVTVKVNGRAVKAEATPTSYLNLRRRWQDGDRVEVEMPMALYTEAMPDDPELVAVMYGPVVLAGLEAPPGGFILSDPTKPEEWVKPTGEPLTFTMELGGQTVTMVPWYRVMDQPYGVYWTVTPEGSEKHKALLAAEEARLEREARVVDRVDIGDEASEQEHNLQGENDGAGPHMDRHWRHAPNGGWFSWDLKVLPDEPMVLMCTHWGSDLPPRKFDVLVDETVIKTVDLNMDDPGNHFDVEYALPEELTKGKDKVTVTFRGYEGNTTGGVFDCAILKAE